ncbi:Putative intracellular protease/amidase (plasmid) [Nostoc flagelliforme CCNUN1]|uniref:Intracellular protease/amidase n=1 Tax=Nostoc flagelliforme CCNUN1 TaxID=2038116 RepID=A0A2K8T5T6_9NOSO|nr:Putative intracellular protease/amidase [Nostoc flagelliforme CCNUN1]
MLDERFYRNNYFCFLVVSDCLVTGQNPASTTGVAEGIVKLLTPLAV